MPLRRTSPRQRSPCASPTSSETRARWNRGRNNTLTERSPRRASPRRALPQSQNQNERRITRGRDDVERVQERTPPVSPEMRRKRCYDQLQQAIATRVPKKKKKRDGTPKDDMLKDFEALGRWAPRNLGMFVSMKHVFQVGMVNEGIIERCEDAEDVDEEPEAQEIRIYHDSYLGNIFTKMITKEPRLREALCEMNYEDGMELASIFHDAFLAAQQDDRGKLRGKIMDLLSDAPTTSAIVHTTKEKRGFNDFLTASKLCPMKYLAEFKADSAEFLEEVLSGERKILAADMPAFLYPDGHIYNAEDPEEDLLRSPLLIRCWKHIFQGNGIVDENRRPSAKKNIAELNGLTEVTGETICYVAVKVRFALSSQPTWNAKDVHFHYPTFYHALLENFEDPEDDFVITTLAYWNKQIDLSSRGEDSSTSVLIQQPPTGSDQHTARQKRRARMAKRKALVNATNNGDSIADSDS